MAQSNAYLHNVAKYPALVRKHMAHVERQFHAYDAIAHKAIDYNNDQVRKEGIALRGKHARPIVSLMDDIDSLRKMMIRIIQVQRQQINKYLKSIRDGRKTVKRGAPASLESVTMETMIQMSLRVIQDMKDAIPSLIQPVVAQIRSKLCTLHQLMLLFKQYTESFGPDDCGDCQCGDCQCDCPRRTCQCNSVGISCHACHQGAHDQCLCNCTE
jgi:hypothetical protein